MKPGYDHPLYILPFDHRPPYAPEVFGFDEPDATATALAAKQIIYEAFLAALANGVARDQAGILVDARFAAPILRDARHRGLLTILPVERSGGAEFDFEAGENFARDIEEFHPAFVKALVRYNPDGDPALNGRQLGRLQRCAAYCHGTGRRFMLEVIVPAEPAQLEHVNSDHRAFDAKLRPALMARALCEIQDAGIEPDVWKLEGVERTADAQAVADAARREGREHVGCIVLGRGEDEAKVRHWLEIAAPVTGFTGFAVGRTTFAGPIVAWRAGQQTREQAVGEIAQRYHGWINVFEIARGRS